MCRLANSGLGIQQPHPEKRNPSLIQPRELSHFALNRNNARPDSAQLSRLTRNHKKLPDRWLVTQLNPRLVRPEKGYFVGQALVALQIARSQGCRSSKP